MKDKSIILFDGVCNLCNRSVQYILKHEKDETLRFSSLQSDYGQKFLNENNLNSNDLKTIIFIVNNKVFRKSKAVILISSYLKFPYNFLRILNFLPIFLLDFVYNLISVNRYKIFGKKDSCLIPDKDIKDRFID